MLRGLSSQSSTRSESCQLIRPAFGDFSYAQSVPPKRIHGCCVYRNAVAHSATRRYVMNSPSLAIDLGEFNFFWRGPVAGFRNKTRADQRIFLSLLLLGRAL